MYSCLTMIDDSVVLLAVRLCASAVLSFHFVVFLCLSTIKRIHVDAFVFTHFNLTRTNATLYMMHNNGVSCQRYRSIYLNSKHTYWEWERYRECLSACKIKRSCGTYTNATSNTSLLCKSTTENRKKEKGRQNNRVINM